jgi:hypothetical protein
MLVELNKTIVRGIVTRASLERALGIRLNLPIYSEADKMADGLEEYIEEYAIMGDKDMVEKLVMVQEFLYVC